MTATYDDFVNAKTLEQPRCADALLPRVTTTQVLVAETCDALRIVVPVPLEAAHTPAALLEPDVVLVAAPGFDDQLVSLSALEMRVLMLVDGYRPLARIGLKSGLTPMELARIVTLLADKGVVMLGGVVRKARDEAVQQLAHEIDRDTEEWTPQVRPAAEPRAQGARGAAVVVAAPGRGARKV